MATRGFTKSSKERIAAKIVAMDDLLDEARRAYAEDRIVPATVALERLEEMKLTELITLFPPIELTEPRKDIPFSVLYETFSRVIHAFFEFLEWAKQQARKPPQERDLSARDRWINEYRGLLDDVRYFLTLPWPPGDPARDQLDSIRRELERLLALLQAFDGAQPPSSSEIEPVWERIEDFLRTVSDASFALTSLFSRLRSIDESIAKLPRLFRDRDDPLTRDFIERAFSAIESWKHEIGEAVAAAQTQ